MPARAHKQGKGIAAGLLELLRECPFDHCNPRDCPLYLLRLEKPAARRAWLNALPEDDLAYLAAYHYTCFGARSAGVKPADR